MAATERGSLTDVGGVRVGHWTHAGARTGCTVVLFPPGTVASGEVRGGSPGTLGWAQLAPERLLGHLDAAVLTGGSAFGLAACDGVMRFCEERGIGLPTAAGPVPIVVGAVLFDLAVGDPSVRPRPSQGYLACQAATTGPVAQGAVGAGTGATVGKWRGLGAAQPGGLGSSSIRHGRLVVAALVAVNAFGDVVPEGAAPHVDPASPTLAAGWAGIAESTTIGVVATNARIDKLGCLLVAKSAHDGLARAVAPVHTHLDGDAIVAAATGSVSAPLPVVRVLAVSAMETAVRAAVGPEKR